MKNTRPIKNKNILKAYLERQKNFVPGISQPPDPNLQFIVVTPCYNEAEILQTIHSLTACSKPQFAIEIIVVVNAPIGASQQVIDQNHTTFSELTEWNDKNGSPKFKIHCIEENDVPQKLAGAGYARKAGMDEAVSRFEQAGKSDGIIISLDADTLCEPNYFIELASFFHKNPKAPGCNFHFEHPFQNITDPNLRSAIVQYELYLRYYKESLKLIGFPYAFHTVGSAFAVRASSYSKQGGMNIKPAGEDFYFLQKIFYLGNFKELNTTTVYPSARISSRAIFGTGQTLSKISHSTSDFLVYDFKTFEKVQYFFEQLPSFFENNNGWITYLDSISPIDRQFLETNGAYEKLIQLRQNISNIKLFEKRFFQVFNNFFIVKWLNFLHQNGFNKKPVIEMAQILLIHLNFKNIPDEKEALLKIYRDSQVFG